MATTEVTNRFKEIKKESEQAGIEVSLLENVEVNYDTPVETSVVSFYKPYQGSGKVKENIVLMTFPGLGRGNVAYYANASDWAQKHGLKKTTPHVINALACYKNVDGNLSELNFAINSWPQKLLIETAGCIYEDVKIAFFLLCRYRHMPAVNCCEVEYLCENAEPFSDFKSWFIFRF